MRFKVLQSTSKSVHIWVVDYIFYINVPYGIIQTWQDILRKEQRARPIFGARESGELKMLWQQGRIVSSVLSQASSLTDIKKIFYVLMTVLSITPSHSESTNTFQFHHLMLEESEFCWLFYNMCKSSHAICTACG